MKQFLASLVLLALLAAPSGGHKLNPHCQPVVGRVVHACHVKYPHQS